MSRNRMLVVCFLPVWLALVMVFDLAIADYYEASVPITARLDVSELNQDQDFDQVDDALRTHWVNTDQDGNLLGRISEIDGNRSIISPVGELRVVLLQNGMVQRQVDATNSDGQFTFDKVEPGDYTLVASGPNGFLAYGVHVLTPLVELAPDDEEARSKQSAFGHQYVSLSDIFPGEVKDQGDLQIDCAAIPPTFVELEKIVSGFLPSDAGLTQEKDAGDKPLENALEIAGGFKYQLDDDGSFTGRVRPLTGEDAALELSDMNVFLLQDDIEMYRVDVDKKGEFRVEDVEPGVYAVVAAGKSGFAALSFELVGANEDQSANGRAADDVYVSLAADRARLPLSITIISDHDDLEFVRQTIMDLNRNAANSNAQANVGDNNSFPTNSGSYPGTEGGIAASSGAQSGPMAPSGSFSGGSGPRGFAGGNGRLRRFLRLTALTAGIIGLGNIDGSPRTASPIQP